MFVAVHSTQRPSGCLHAGAAGEVQFASVVQPSVHACVTVLHLPFRPPHCESFTHSTHMDPGTKQTGFPPLHAVQLAALHSTHVPEKLPTVRHAGLASVGHVYVAFDARSPVQPTHVPAALQIGVLPEHCASLVHWTHVWVVAWQAGVAPLQSSRLPVVHCTHLPTSGPDLTQAGAEGDVHWCGVPVSRSPSHGTHVPPEQIGVEPEQWLFDRHSTHVLLVRLHFGTVPPHCPSDRHATQRCDAVLQCGVGSVQFVSSLQPVVHVWESVLQIAFVPVHCASLVHSTHVLVPVSHAGRAAGQCEVFVALHVTHEPPTQAGLSLERHANVALLP